MDFFGTPIYISFSDFLTFITTNFSNLTFSNDTLLICFFLGNILLIMFMIFKIAIIYKLIIYAKNILFP
jgi:hypothetical protein